MTCFYRIPDETLIMGHCREEISDVTVVLVQPYGRKRMEFYNWFQDTSKSIRRHTWVISPCFRRSRGTSGFHYIGYNSGCRRRHRKSRSPPRDTDFSWTPRHTDRDAGRNLRTVLFRFRWSSLHPHSTHRWVRYPKQDTPHWKHREVWSSSNFYLMWFGLYTVHDRRWWCEV